MYRIMAIDYGEKRIGIAFTDPLRIIAKPFGYILNTGFNDVCTQIKQFIQEKTVKKIVIGLPLNLKGVDSKKTIEVRKFTEELKSNINIDIEFQDERFTSVEAEESLKKSGYSVRQSRQKVDAVAASLILQAYLKRV